jgi:hypothetical protein
VPFVTAMTSPVVRRSLKNGCDAQPAVPRPKKTAA